LALIASARDARPRIPCIDGNKSLSPLHSRPASEPSALTRHYAPPHLCRKKTAIALVAILIALVIIGYTYTPPAAAPVVKGNLKESKVLSMALKGAKCDDGSPDAVVKVANTTGSTTTYTYKYK
jgi:hypothetical protein